MCTEETLVAWVREWQGMGRRGQMNWHRANRTCGWVGYGCEGKASHLHFGRLFPDIQLQKLEDKRF